VISAVLCIGLAKTGEAVASVLTHAGDTVTVVEERPGGTDYATRREAVIALGARVIEAPDPGALEAAVDAADLVVPSPGVRPSHPALVRAEARGVPVRSELDLAAQRISAPLVAVTGTNGKTTTTDLITRILMAAGHRVVCGGNIGTPLLSLLDQAATADVVVAEVSSFQLEFTTEHFRPRVAVLLNVADDHLDWHGTPAAYGAAKAKVFAHQTADDVLVVNADDRAALALASTARSRTIPVTLHPPRPNAWTSDDDALRDANGGVVIDIQALRRRLPHDRTNALCAAAATDALGSVGADHATIAKVLEGYEPMAHRVELVADHEGVRWYDDSKATNPHAALRAIEAFPSVVLLAGGLNKDLDLGSLRAGADHVRAVVAFGSSADEVAAAFDGLRSVVRADSMHAIVHAAAALAQPGDAVLLSPGCASFDMYTGGYTERGDDFAREVRALLYGAPAARQSRDPVEQEA
jgi:UDP-N-acetylmuramoylalanine--D-glutamate ligase